MSDNDQNIMDSELGDSQFAKLARDLRGGVINHEASEQMQECVAQAKLTGKSAKLTITVDFKPSNGDQVQIIPNVTAKIPQEKLPSSIMFMDDDGFLHQKDPNQPELKFQTVDTKKTVKEAPKKEIKEA